MTHDFQITFVTGDLLKTLADYNRQRQDIIAVVSSTSELFTEELRSAPQILSPLMKINYPDILLIGASILA
jgi:hypothetical protein